MIVYVDTSALVKRYVREASSQELQTLLMAADVVTTAYITRPEVVAAIAKARRTGILWPNVAMRVLEKFRSEWNDYWQLPISESVIERADSHAWTYQLRGFDAIHLATAQLFQETLQEPVTLATFDQQLEQAASQIGLQVWPAQSNG